MNINLLAIVALTVAIIIAGVNGSLVPVIVMGFFLLANFMIIIYGHYER